MQSTAKDVTSYLLHVPTERQGCLAAMRVLCLETLTDYHESMDYGMPCYAKDGKVEVAFASQKNYISLYILKKDVVDANRALLSGLNVGKGCIKYTRPANVDLDVVKKLLEDTLTFEDSAC